MKLLGTVALALASASTFGQDAPDAVLATAESHAATAQKLEEFDCRVHGARLCDHDNQRATTLRLVNNYKDAILLPGQAHAHKTSGYPVENRR